MLLFEEHVHRSECGSGLHSGPRREDDRPLNRSSLTGAGTRSVTGGCRLDTKFFGPKQIKIIAREWRAVRWLHRSFCSNRLSFPNSNA